MGYVRKDQSTADFETRMHGFTQQDLARGDDEVKRVCGSCSAKLSPPGVDAVHNEVLALRTSDSPVWMQFWAFWSFWLNMSVFFQRSQYLKAKISQKGKYTALFQVGYVRKDQSNQEWICMFRHALGVSTSNSTLRVVR